MKTLPVVSDYLPTAPSEDDIRQGFISWAMGLFKVRPEGDDLDRPLVITPFGGCYGVAGHVLVVNGSPPRAVVVIEPASRNMIATRMGRIVRGSGYANSGAGLNRRYAEAEEWLRLLNVENLLQQKTIEGAE